MGDAPIEKDAGQPSPMQDSESLTSLSIRLGLPDGGEAHNTTRAVNSEIRDDSRANYLHNSPGQTSAEKKCAADDNRTVRSEDHDPKAQAREPHKTKRSPQEPSVTAFKKLQKLRGGSTGLMLGTYSRGVAASLDVQSAGNAEKVCNMLLCSSHVTEMGFQLEEQVDKVAALKAQNNALKAQRDTFQAKVIELQKKEGALKAQNGSSKAQKASLQARTIVELKAQVRNLELEKAAVKIDMSALSGPELHKHLHSILLDLQAGWEELGKFLVPGQGTSGRSDQARQENSDIKLSSKLSKTQAKQQESSVELNGMSSESDANEPKSGPKTTSKAAAPSSKAVRRSTRCVSEQPKGGVPRFMSPTAATKSRAPVSKSAATEVVVTKPHTR